MCPLGRLVHTLCPLSCLSVCLSLLGQLNSSLGPIPFALSICPLLVTEFTSFRGMSPAGLSRCLLFSLWGGEGSCVMGQVGDFAGCNLLGVIIIVNLPRIQAMCPAQCQASHGHPVPRRPCEVDLTLLTPEKEEDRQHPRSFQAQEAWDEDGVKCKEVTRCTAPSQPPGVLAREVPNWAPGPASSSPVGALAAGSSPQAPLLKERCTAGGAGRGAVTASRP